MQTAVEWLFEELNIWQTIADEDTNATLDTVRKLLEQAKQMENVEIIKRTLDGAEDTADYVDKVIIKALVEDMHKQPLTFVSKEISDEEIEKAAENYGWRIKTNTFSDAVKANELAESAKQDFIEGAKWYREQLKKK